MAEYATALGFVQFDPRVRDVNNQRVVDVTIKTPGMDGVLIRVTIWPELQSYEVKKGDFIAVDGKLTVGTFEGRDGQTRQSIQISASSLAVFPGITPNRTREVVNESSQNEPGNLF